MDRKELAKKLVRLAGSIMGPGIPDGSGPCGGTDECPMTDDAPMARGRRYLRRGPQDGTGPMGGTDECPMAKEELATELVRLAKALVAGAPALSNKEKAVAKKMQAKGYNYIVQITTVDGDFGEPLYFKHASEVGPFLRNFPDYQKAKIKWTATLSDFDLD